MICLHVAGISWWAGKIFSHPSVSRPIGTRPGRPKTIGRIFFTVLLLALGILDSFAQPSVGDYQSVNSGNWSILANWERFNGTTWETPTFVQGYPGQNAGTGRVAIQNGHTVTINATPANPVSSLFVNASGVLQYEATTARTLRVSEIITINSGATFRSALTGAVTTHQLIVDGSIVSNGTINFSTNNNASGAGITFTGAANEVFDISGAALTNLRSTNGLALNKGTSATSVLSFIPGGTIQVLSGNAFGFLRITNGTFAIIGENTFSNPVFYATGGSYAIPATGGFRLGNPNAIIVGMYGTVTNSGEMIITDGTYNIGTGSGNSLVTNSTGEFEMSGGTLNIAGRFRISGGDCKITGGTICLATVGHADKTLAAFHVSQSADLIISGNPLITFTHPNSNLTPFNDIEIISGIGYKNITGGTFQMGTAASPANSTFLVNSDIPVHNLAVYNSSTRVSLTDHLTVDNQLTLNGQLLLNNQNLTMGSSAPAIAVTGNGMIVCNNGATGGEVRKMYSDNGSYTFPVGETIGLTEYSPLTINFTSGTYAGGAYAAAKVVNTKHPDNKNTTDYLNRYWSLSNSGITSATYNLDANYLPADVTGTEADITVGVSTASLWVKYGTANTATHILSATGVTQTGISIGFSGIALAATIVAIIPEFPTICSGSSVTLTASATGGPIRTYSWSPATGLSATNIASPVANPTSTTPYTVTVTDWNGDVVSVSVTVTVNPLLPVSVSLAVSSNPVCAGTLVTFTATPTNGGTAPVYLWTVNGTPVGTNNPIYIYSPSVNDAVTCELTSNAICATGNPAISNTVNMIVNPFLPVSVSISTPSNTICAGTPVTFTATPTNGGSPPMYQWRVNGVNFGASTSSNTFTTTTLQNGHTVSVSVTSNISPCASGSPSPSNIIPITVNPIPSAPTGGNIPPVCEGGAINLTASAIAGATYTWIGPNSFTSALQNPSIPNATAAMNGIYSVTATVNNCTSPAVTTSIVVNPIPATPTPVSNSPVCEGGTINLSTPVVAGAIYSWSGPNGYTSSAQNPVIANATGVMEGIYNVTTTVSGCVSVVGTTNVDVNPRPSLPTASSNSTICVDGTINLTTAEVIGATYLWTGPNSFISLDQNPTIVNATSAMAGSYAVTVTVAGCSSLAGTTSVVVNPVPSTPTVTSNSPLCAGSTIILTTPLVIGATYAWTGPNSYTSVAQNPTIVNATLAMEGTYSVTVTMADCSSLAGTISVVVNPVPATPTVSSNSPLCAGNAINLTTPLVAGATYSWTGPNGYTSVAQNPTISNVTGTMAGSYAVTVSVAGCSSLAGTTSVVVNPVPATVTVNSVAVGGTISGGATVCSGTNTTVLTLTGHTGTVFRWESSLDNFATAGTTINNTTNTITASNLTASTSYRAVVQSGVCAASNSITATVSVNPVSVGGTISGGTAVCSGTNTTVLTLTGHTGTVVRWESSLDNFATAGTTINNTTTTLTAGNLTASTSFRAVVQSGVCLQATSTSATVTVNPVAVGGTLSPDRAFGCIEGNSGTITLTGNIGPVIRWEQSIDAGYTWLTQIANTSTTLNYSNLTRATFYRAVVQNGNCAIAYSTPSQIVVNTAFVPVITASSLTTCINQTVTLTAAGYTSSGQVITGGDFAQANPSGWNGASANNSNANPNSGWGEANGPKSWNGVTYNSGGKFMIINGIGNPGSSVLTTPIFSLTGLPAAYLALNQAFNLTAGASASIQISIDGGASFITLQTYTVAGAAPGLNYGPTNGLHGTDIFDISRFLGLTNLQIRFIYAGTPGSNWAIDNVFVTNSASNPTGVNVYNNLVHTWSSIWQALSSTSVNVVTFTPTTAGVKTIKLSTSAGGCAATTTSIDITVNPIPVIKVMTSIACSRVAFTVTPADGTNGTVPVGTTYSWPLPVVTGGLTGGATGTNATSITGALTNPTNTPQTATYSVTPRSGTCLGSPFTVTVTVNPTPAITAMTSIACSGDAFSATPVNGTNGIVPVGITYTWSATTVTGGMTGGAASSGALASISGTLINPTIIPQTATYIITPIGPNCTGATFQLVVTVNPKPAITPMTAIVCSGVAFSATPVNGTNGIVPTGTTYSWSAPAGAGFTGGVSGSGASTISGTLVNTTAGSVTATYTVTPLSSAAGSCNGASFTVTVTINPLPSPSLIYHN